MSTDPSKVCDESGEFSALIEAQSAFATLDKSNELQHSIEVLLEIINPKTKLERIRYIEHFSQKFNTKSPGELAFFSLIAEVYNKHKSESVSKLFKSLSDSTQSTDDFFSSMKSKLMTTSISDYDKLNAIKSLIGLFHNQILSKKDKSEKIFIFCIIPAIDILLKSNDANLVTQFESLLDKVPFRNEGRGAGKKYTNVKEWLAYKMNDDATFKKNVFATLNKQYGISFKEHDIFSLLNVSNRIKRAVKARAVTGFQASAALDLNSIAETTVTGSVSMDTEDDNSEAGDDSTASLTTDADEALVDAEETVFDADTAVNDAANSELSDYCESITSLEDLFSILDQLTKAKQLMLGKLLGVVGLYDKLHEQSSSLSEELNGEQQGAVKKIFGKNAITIFDELHSVSEEVISFDDYSEKLLHLESLGVDLTTLADEIPFDNVCDTFVRFSLSIEEIVSHSEVIIKVYGQEGWDCLIAIANAKEKLEAKGNYRQALYDMEQIVKKYHVPPVELSYDDLCQVFATNFLDYLEKPENPRVFLGRPFPKTKRDPFIQAVIDRLNKDGVNGEYAVYGATLLESEQDEQNRQLRRAAIIDDKNGEESEEEDDDEINDYSIESPKAPEKDSRRLFERLATPPSHLIFSQKVQLLRDFISDFEAIETQQERDEFASAILVSHRLLLDGCCEAAISSSDDEDRDLVLRYAEFVEIYYSQSDDSALIETREHEPALPSMELLDEIRSFTFKPKTAAVSSKSELPPEVLVSEEPVHTTDFGLSPSTLAKIAERLRHHSPMAAETTSSTAAAPIAESLKQLAEGVLGTTFTSPKDAFYALNSAQSLQHAQVDIKSLVKSTLTLIDKRYEENFDDEEETNKELAKAFGVEVGGQISIINMRELLKRLENPSVLDMHAELSASDIVHQTLEVSDAEQAHQETPVHTHEPEQLPLSMSVSPSMTALKAEAIDALTSLAKSFPNDQELTRYCQEKLSELDRQTSEEAIDSTHIKRIVSEANTLKEIMVAANLIISAFKSGPSALKRFLVPKALEIQTALDATPAEDRLKLVRFTGNYVHSKGKKTAIDEFLEKLAAPFIGKEEKLVKNAFDTFKGKMLQLSSGVKQGANESQAASARSENSKDAGRK